MDAELQAERQKKKDLILKEMARRSNDEILLYNPTLKDYFVRWGGMYWEVPNRNKDSGQGKGKAILLRYLAEKYRREIVDSLIHRDSAVIVEKAKAKYTGNFFPAVEERIALRTNNPELRKKYIKVVWLGLHKRYGLDELPGGITGTVAKPQDKRPLDDILQEEIENETKEIPDELIQNKPTQKEEFAKAISEKEKK